MPESWYWWKDGCHDCQFNTKLHHMPLPVCPQKLLELQIDRKMYETKNFTNWTRPSDSCQRLYTCHLSLLHIWWRRPTVGGCSPIFHEKTLVVQIHRDETERLQSGIKMAVTQWVCNHARYKVGSTKYFSHCILNEGRAIYIIKERVREIEIESPKILTFKTFLRP